MTVCGAVSPNSQEEVEPCLAPKTQKPRYCGCSAFTSNGKDLRTNQLDLHLDPNRHFASPQGPPIMPADSMALASLNPSLPVCRERVVSVQRQEEHFACVFANQTKLLLHRFLAKSVAIGDEITFPIPAPDAGAPKFSSTRMPPPGRAVISTRRQSDTSASPSRTNEISTSFLPRFNGEASASARFSCLARFCASTSIACRLRPTKSIIPLCTRSCVSQPALRPLNFAWLSSCAIWN